MKTSVFHVTLYAIVVYLTGAALQSAGASPHPLAKNRTHVCGVIDDWGGKRYADQYPNRRYARSLAANLNVGEPRTVRLIYFLPNDRPYRADVVQRMKAEILNVQTFFADQMEAHGYGRRTFRIETDAQGEPIVHRVNGKHPDSHYLDDTLHTVDDEVYDVFDLYANVYFTVIDNSIDGIGRGNGRVTGGVAGRRGKNGGRTLMPGGFSFTAAAHELGHTFGLKHDFSDDAYIMSYGGQRRSRLSACSAEFLSVHPYFNPNTPIEEGEGPTIELISSPLYPAGSRSVRVRLKINDLDGLHQLIFFVYTIAPHSAAGSREVKVCRGLVGKRDTVVEFDYDGVIPSDGFTSLSDPTAHAIRVDVVDKDGDVDYASFTLAEISPYHIASLDRHTDYVESVTFSPDGGTLASGSWDEAVKLWDVTTQTNIATLGHNGWVSSVSFSPNGTTLASGSGAVVKLWDVTTRTNVATLEGHTTGVRSVSFSPDGTVLASGSGNDGDGEVKLWDVATQTSVATLWHTDPVKSVSFSPDGTILASGSGDGAVKLWDVTMQTNLATLEGHTNWVYSVSFSPDGTILASGSGDRTVKLWDVTTQTNVATLEGHNGWVSSVSFSPDGTILASGSGDGAVKLWDVTTQTNIATFWHTAEVTSVSFSADGTTLASGTNAGTVELWDMSMLMEVRVEMFTEVEIPDPNLRAAIADAIGVSPNSPIYRGNLEDLTALEASKANITDLTGLEFATKLTELNIRSNSVSDILSLSGLTRLETLYLNGNSASDISLLSGLTNLRTLGLNANSISDILSLSGLTNLTTLYLGSNSVSDISSLSGLTNLRTLYLDNNSVSDISSLSGLTNLRTLYLGYNEISDVSPLLGLNLAGTPWDPGLSLNGNPLSYTSINIHIPDLRKRGVEVHADNLKPPTLEYTLSIPAGLNLIHVPLQVSAVDGVAKTLTSISDLYDALGGVNAVNFLITYDTSTQGWLTYFGVSEKGTANDKTLTDAMGIIAGMKIPTSVRLTGKPLGNNGSSTIGLTPGLNIVGLPLRDSRVNRVSDLLRLDGIWGNVPIVTFTVNGDFTLVGRAGDSNDIPITGGQGFILTAQRATTVTLSGEGWTNDSATAAPLMALTGLPVRHTTPVLALKGEIVDEVSAVNRVGFRVTVKNLSTGRQVATTAADAEAGYRLTIVDIETMRAARVGDVLEISAQSKSPFIGVGPLQYTVTVEDVKQGWIQLPALVAYEIPTETELLANYPNPFNPETWIPYRLAEDADVKLTIYDGKGRVVRAIDVGHRIAAVYESRSKAIYWDGRNAVGEQVASGVYFYSLTAGDYSATRKMLVLK